MTLEGNKHEPGSAGQSSAGALPKIEAANNCDRRESSTGSHCREGRLDGVGSPSGSDSGQQAKECGGAPAAFARDVGSDVADGDTQDDLPRGRGPNSPLCTSSVLVRLDRDRLDTGLHHHSRLYGADGRGRTAAHQSVRGGSGGGREVSRPPGDGCGYHSPRSGNSLAERDGTDGFVSNLYRSCQSEGRKRLTGICEKGSEKIQSWEGENSKVPSLCQDEGSQEQGCGADGLSHREYSRATRPSPGGAEAASGKLRESCAGQSHPHTRDDEKADATDSLLAENRPCSSRQNYQPSHSSVVSHCSRQSRQDRGIWTDLGNQPAARWISSCNVGPKSQRISRFEICGSSGGRAHRDVWQGAPCVCLRPGWLQCGERRRSQSQRNPPSGVGAPRQDAMGTIGCSQREVDAGKGAHRGWHRCHQESEIRIQPTSRALLSDDGSLRTTGGTGFQSEQADTRAGQEKWNGSGWMRAPRWPWRNLGGRRPGQPAAARSSTSDILVLLTLNFPTSCS